jgi:hypothetical protein
LVFIPEEPISDPPETGTFLKLPSFKACPAGETDDPEGIKEGI